MYQLEVAADSTSQSEMKRQVAELSSMKKGRNTDGQLRSPYTGVVVNVRADEGDVVSVGTPILIFAGMMTLAILLPWCMFPPLMGPE